MRKINQVAGVLFLLTLVSASANGQQAVKPGPFSLDEIIDWKNNDVPCKPLTERVNARGTDFAATAEAIQRLQNAGLCSNVIDMVRKLSPAVNLMHPEVAGPINRGKAYLDQGQYPDAIKEFELARAADSKNPESIALIAQTRKAMEAEKSLSTGRLSLETIEGLARDLTARRLITLVNNNGIRCVPRQELMEKFNRNGTDDRLLITIEKNGLENQKELAKLTDSARASYEQGQYSPAIKELEKSRSICPADAGIVANLEQVRSAQVAENNLRPGALALSDVIKLLTGKVINGRVADLVTDRKVNFKTLSDADEKAIRGAGGDIEVLTAIRRQTLPPPPQPPQPGPEVKLVLTGNEMRRTQKYQQALEFAEQALKINARYDKAWELKGDALWGLKRFAEAVKSFDNAVEINPMNALAWAKRGLVFQDMKEYGEALQSFDRSLDINPLDPTTWIFKGDSLRAMNRCDEAKNSYDRALGIDKNKQLTLEERYQALRKCAS